MGARTGVEGAAIVKHLWPGALEELQDEQFSVRDALSAMLWTEIHFRKTPSGPRPRRLFLGPLADSYASTWFREQMGAEHAWWEEQAQKIPHWEILVYETLNFTDGKRSLAEIEDAVRAEFGDLPDGTVERILRDLEKVKLVEFAPAKPE